MALILLTAGTSKFFSGGGFADYYSGQFANEALRITLPGTLTQLYLTVIPFIEVALGAALLVSRLKPWTLYAWYAFMASLLVGHYILQEWSEVNQMLDYFFLGFLCHILPTFSLRDIRTGT
ncbi:MAG: hypothetical protein CMK09_06915 [Ponticaulis sp.]|nr:hypothetical protein [Ponticaulis sp.]|tara:strand:- start:76088 stop:76450 length:363 start_codon:yes stop_codon:yes gene_type:complete